MIAKFKLEDVFIVGGGVVICGPLIKGDITLDSIIILGDKRVSIHKIEMLRKSIRHATKGDIVGIFLKDGFVTKDELKKLKEYGSKTDFLDIVNIKELRINKLESIGI